MARALHPYRPNTMKAYRRQFHLFMFYSIKNRARVVLSVENLLSFLEFLVACNLSPRAVSNYASSIKSYASVYQLPVDWMKNTLVTNYLRALHIQVVSVKKEKSTLSLQDMYNVSVALDKFDNPMVYRAAILLSFYRFSRISNLVASTLGSFDPNRQLCREDVALLADSV